MKKLVVVLGPNGVGKSTACAAVLEQCPRCAYVDADWCRAINPFPFTEATRRAAMENIFCLLKNYLLCAEIDTVLFPYGFHGDRQKIFEQVLQRLREEADFLYLPVVLTCSLEENRRRAQQDGRDAERIERGIKNTFHFYDAFGCPILDTTALTPGQVAAKIRALAGI